MLYTPTMTLNRGKFQVHPRAMPRYTQREKTRRVGEFLPPGALGADEVLNKEVRIIETYAEKWDSDELDAQEEKLKVFGLKLGQKVTTLWNHSKAAEGYVLGVAIGDYTHLAVWDEGRCLPVFIDPNWMYTTKSELTVVHRSVDDSVVKGSKYLNPNGRPITTEGASDLLKAGQVFWEEGKLLPCLSREQLEALIWGEGCSKSN